MEEQWFTIYNELNAKKKELKEMKKLHTEMTNTILEKMINENIEYININNSNKKLVLNEKTTFGTINKDYILETLNNYIVEKSPKTTNGLAENMTESIMNNREQKKKIFLKLAKK